MNYFSIKDIENLTGIKAHTLRIWEQRYGILLPKRTPTNIRYYDGQDLKNALRIALLNSYGYKISRIHQMTEQDINSLIQKISDNDFRLQLMVNELLEAMMDMDTEHFELLLTGYIKKHGLEQTIEQLVFNFLEKVGIMWMTGRTSPAHEHLVSNIIYRKLAIGIEQLLPKKNTASPGVLLFLPEGEIHDISLMYIHYLLRKHDKDPIYLGPNTPLENVKVVYEQKQPDYLYIHLTATAGEFNIDRYIYKLTQAFPKTKILISGAILKSARTPVPANIRFLHNLAEAREVLIML